MNWNEVEGYWTQYRGKVREQLGKFARSRTLVEAAQRQQLLGLMQRRHGALQAEAKASARGYKSPTKS